MINHSVRFFQHHVTHNNTDQLKGPTRKTEKPISENYAEQWASYFFKGHTKGLVTRQIPREQVKQVNQMRPLT